MLYCPVVNWKSLWKITIVCLVVFPQLTGRKVKALDEKDDAKSFVHSMAEGVFVLAWPTATFKKASFKSFSPVRSGFDVVFHFTGTSSWNDGNLWMDLLFEVRNGELQSIKVKGHNAFLAAPFETVGNFSKLVLELNEKYKQNQRLKERYRHPTQPKVTDDHPWKTIDPLNKISLVCINNNSGIDIVFWYRWGIGEWKKITLEKGYSFWFSHAIQNTYSPDFQVHFDRHPSPNSKKMETWNLRKKVAYVPAKCENARKYDFVLNRGVLGLKARTWDAGLPHPQIIGLVCSSQENQYKPGPEYRWTYPNDKNSLSVLKKDRGYVGVTLVNKTTSFYPVVHSVLKGFPADQFGIKIGMEITSVNGTSMFNKTAEQCRLALKGPIGSFVIMEFKQEKSDPVVKWLTRK